MAIKHAQIEKTFYKVKLFIQPKNGSEKDKIDISNNISGMVILKKFNEHSMPIIRVVANLSINQVKNIQQNFSAGDAYFTLEKLFQNRGDKPGRPMESFDAVYKDVPLTIIGLDRNDIDSKYANGDTSTNDNMANMPNIEFPLEFVPSNALKMNEQVMPQVLNDTDTLNVLTKIISDNHVPNYKVCFAKPDLNKKFNSFNIPSKSLHQFTKYAQKVYGIYNSPMISFFDIDKYYLMASGKLAKFPQDRPLYLDNCQETHISFITDSETQVNSMEGSYYDGEAEVARVVSFKQPKLNLSDPARKYVDGNHVKIMLGNFAIRAAHECFMQQMGDNEPLVGKEKIAVARYDNPTIANQYQFTSQENYAPTQIDVNNVDIRIFDPRKKFLFKNDTNNDDSTNTVHGYWRLYAVQFTFLGEGNTEDTILTVNVKADFRPFLAQV